MCLWQPPRQTSSAMSRPRRPSMYMMTLRARMELATKPTPSPSSTAAPAPLVSSPRSSRSRTFLFRGKRLRPRVNNWVRMPGIRPNINKELTCSYCDEEACLCSHWRVSFRRVTPSRSFKLPYQPNSIRISRKRPRSWRGQANFCVTTHLILIPICSEESFKRVKNSQMGNS